jgi:hypothetical protein
MGIAYVVVGGLCVLLGALFTIAHLFRPRYAYFPALASIVHRKTDSPHRKLGDHTYLTWNNDQEDAAMATGRDARFGPNAH